MKKMYVIILFSMVVLTEVSCTNAQAKKSDAQQIYTKYVLVSRPVKEYENFQEAVIYQLTKNNFKLVGGVSSDGTTLYQAMAK